MDNESGKSFLSTSFDNEFRVAIIATLNPLAVQSRLWIVHYAPL